MPALPQAQIVDAPKPYALTGVTIPLAASTAATAHTFNMSGRDILFAFGNGAAGNLVLNGVPNSRNRDSDPSIAIASGSLHVIGPLRDLEGWQTPSGMSVTPDLATVQLAVVRLHR